MKYENIIEEGVDKQQILSYTQICKVLLFNQNFVLFLGAQIDFRVEKWKKSYKEEENT